MKKKQTVIIVLVIAALAVAAGILACVNAAGLRSSGGASADTLTVVSGDTTLATYTVDDIEKMKSIDIKKKITSGDGTTEEGRFRGVPLSEILEAAGADVTDSVEVQSTDGFTASFDAGEISAESDVILAYQKDGEPLGSSQDGGTGPFRIIVADDQYGNRCARYVCRITAD